MDRLIVKNFGPLKDIDIELNKINLFIGENGSGKSVLAKLATILFSYKKTIESIKFFNTKQKQQILNSMRHGFRKELKTYNINYLNSDSFIKINNDIIFDIEFRYYGLNTEQVNQYDTNIVLEEYKKILNKDNKKNSNTISNLFVNIYKYIPAERNILSILNESINSLVRYRVPLPDFLLDFASEYEYARKEIKELEALNVKYQFDGSDKIYYDKDNYLKLSHSSSGIQSAIPMLLTTKYFAKKYGGIVIEEPEQNLFPKAQDEVIKFIVEQVNIEKSNLFLMTHSPYVLSTLNNLIFAHKVSNLNDKAKEQAEELIKEEQWINPDSFSAYFLKDGVTKSIVGKRGLISDNIIDDVSDEVDREFEELMEIYREYKQ